MLCREPKPAPTRTRREPQRGALHQVLLRHLQTDPLRNDPQDRFDAAARHRGLPLVTDKRAGPGLPGFVRRELYGYLDCGILANGFARVHCASCGRDELVAFSCKGRGFCPSCGGRRMAETAMHLADEALPAVPLRQGALFPLLRALHLAYDAELCAAVRRIFVRALLAWHAARAERAAVAAGRSGAVVVAQRFGSALNLNLHFHALLLDGVYASPERRTRWVPAFGRRDDAYDDDLVCASRLAPELMAKLGGFDTKKLLPYKPEYLAGWRAEEYQLDLEGGWGKSQENVVAAQQSRCAGDVPGDTQRNLRVRNAISGVRWKHVLLPLWSLQYRFGGETYTVLVNGQNGCIAGKAPLSWVKIGLFALALAAGVGLVALIAALR